MRDNDQAIEEQDQHPERLTSILKAAYSRDCWADLSDGDLLQVAFVRYTDFGRTQDIASCIGLFQLHELLCKRLADEVRLQLAQDVTRYITETGDSGEMALDPFIRWDTALHVVASSSLDLAMLMDGPVDVEMPGPLFLLDLYQGGSEFRRLGILMGLLVLGDLRLLPFIKGLWRDFRDRDLRLRLSGAFSGFVYPLQIEFLLDWLECTKDEGDFGAIAGALARMPIESVHKCVEEVHRSFPASRAVDGNPVQVLRQWSFAEYARDHLAHRLEPLIDRETEPKVLPVVTEAWSQ